MSDERILSFPNAKSAADYTRYMLQSKSDEGKTSQGPQSRQAERRSRSKRRTPGASRVQQSGSSVFDRLGTVINYPTRRGVAFLGDSIMVRLCHHLRIEIPPLSPLCRSGLTTGALLKALPANVPHLPDKIVLLVGINDVTQNVTRKNFQQNVARICKLLEPKKLHIFTILPLNIEKDETIQLMNEIIEGHSGNHVKVVDAYSIFLRTDGTRQDSTPGSLRYIQTELA